MRGFNRDKSRATEAFRKWGRAGCPGMAEIRRRGGPAARDMMACAAAFDVLESGRRKNAAGRDIVEAVRAVYMADPGRPLRRAEVTGRVRNFALRHYVSERTVFYWLGTARKLWAELRESD